jgi:capsule polysaccharide export protein KpsC/LpsZ
MGQYNSKMLLSNTLSETQSSFKTFHSKLNKVQKLHLLVLQEVENQPSRKFSKDSIHYNQDQFRSMEKTLKNFNCIRIGNRLDM